MSAASASLGLLSLLRNRIFRIFSFSFTPPHIFLFLKSIMKKSISCKMGYRLSLAKALILEEECSRSVTSFCSSCPSLGKEGLRK